MLNPENHDLSHLTVSDGTRRTKGEARKTSNPICQSYNDNQPSPLTERNNSSSLSWTNDANALKTTVTSNSQAVGSQDEREKNGQFISTRKLPRQPSSFENGDWWVFEVLSCLLATFSVTAIVVVLRLYEDKALPSWPLDITLNTFLAFFTTLAKAGLMIPISEAISQLKWVWFAQDERQLVDFQTYDEASRGPLGSLKLLYTLKGRHLASIGAIISILSLATDPITQQIVAYPTRQVPHSLAVAEVQRSNYFMGYISFPRRFVPDVPMKQAINFGLFSPINETIPHISPTCSTGNCTWPEYSSLGVCAKVANITDQLTVAVAPGNFSAAVRYNMSINVSLTNGAFLQADSMAMNISSILSPPRSGPSWWNTNDGMQPSLAFTSDEDVNTRLVDFFVIYLQSTSSGAQNFRAVEVLLQWCVKTYVTNVTAGVATTFPIAKSTRVLSTNGSITISNETHRRQLIMAPESAEATSENYTVDPTSAGAIGTYLQDMFAGTYSLGVTGIASSDAASALVSILYANTSSDAIQYTSIERAAENMAASMTNNVRDRQFRGEAARGTAFISESFVRVRWEWLVFLASLVVLTTGFLVATMVKSRVARVDVLKSSALAAMCGLSDDSRAAMGIGGIEAKIEDKAAYVKVRFDKTNRGWNFETTRS